MRGAVTGYVALVRILVPRNGHMVCVAEPGQSCARVPPDALLWLLRRGKVRKQEKKEQTHG